MSETAKGLDLAERLYVDAVKPLIEEHFPQLQYAAALIGPGSEVLGYDDEMSRDHHWGPRFQLFLNDEDIDALNPGLIDLLANHLPYSVDGVPTNFSEPGIDGSQMPVEISAGPVNHRIEVTSAPLFMQRLLGFDPREEPTAADWLSFSSQSLLCLTAGKVFHDEIRLQSLRERIAYYPHDVWLYLMASSWQRISQEEHLVGRAGYVGDNLGARIIAGRLVGDIMMLAFYQARTYFPYAKWFQRAFEELPLAGQLMPHLNAALGAQHGEERLSALAAAYEIVAEGHNALSVTEQVSPQTSNFWSRPFPVIHGERLAGVLTAVIKDPEVRVIADKGMIGGVDQISDQTDFKHPHWRRRIAALYPR